MEEVKEELIRTWIELTGLIKNNRIMKSISYNEAIILNYTYHAYTNNKGIYVQEILKRTRLLKSLCNRTINLLLDKELILKKQDKNQLVLYFNPLKESEYKKIHQETMMYLSPILERLDEKDTKEFIRIIQKITRSTL